MMASSRSTNGNAILAGGVAEKNEHHDEPKRDAHEVLLHPAPLVSAIADAALLLYAAAASIAW